METIEVRECCGYQEYTEVLNLFYSYICELHQKDSRVKVRSKEEISREYFNKSGTTIWILKESRGIIGFSVIGEGEGSHPLVDMYIGEFYIRPEYRNQYYGRDFIKKIIAAKGAERVCYYVLVKNYVAEKFWERVFKEWQDVTIVYLDVNQVDKSLLKWKVKEI